MNSREAFEAWFREQQGKPYDSYFHFARDAWQAATERAAKVCQAWGDEKVAYWANDPTMVDDAKDRAWDAECCASRIRVGND